MIYKKKSNIRAIIPIIILVFPVDFLIDVFTKFGIIIAKIPKIKAINRKRKDIIEENIYCEFIWLGKS